MAQRRRNRFSRLEQQFRESGGTAAPGSKLAGYIDFKRGVNRIDIREARRLTAAQRRRFGFAVLPFGLSTPATPGADDRYAAPITAYSNQYRVVAGLTNAELGYDDIVGATNQADNFFPAICRFFINFGTVLTPLSGVTRKEYRRKDGRSISVPFGRTITNVTDQKAGTAEATVDDVDYEDMKSSLSLQLRNKVVEGGIITSISFEPEIWRVGKPDLASPAT